MESFRPLSGNREYQLGALHVVSRGRLFASFRPLSGNREYQLKMENDSIAFLSFRPLSGNREYQHDGAFYWDMFGTGLFPSPLGEQGISTWNQGWTGRLVACSLVSVPSRGTGNINPAKTTTHSVRSPVSVPSRGTGNINLDMKQLRSIILASFRPLSGNREYQPGKFVEQASAG